MHYLSILPTVEQKHDNSDTLSMRNPLIKNVPFPKWFSSCMFNFMNCKQKRTWAEDFYKEPIIKFCYVCNAMHVYVKYNFYT